MTLSNVDSENELPDSKINIKHIGTDFGFTHKIVWKNAIGFLVLHLLALWGLFILFTGGIQLKTLLWTIFVLFWALEGVTIGAHRLFSHKSFKASPLVKAVLLVLHTTAGQNSMFIWCRDHRLHHRYSDTDADPHNAKRGFFFSHIGWLMTKKHPYVIELGKKTDMSDLHADWMVMFENKYYYPLYIVLAILIPVTVPIYYFNEPWLESFLVAYVARYILGLNFIWLVNSAAHLWGTRPYDKNLQPAETWLISFLTQGEGWHNYHHAFPWDYKAAEFSNHFNVSARIIKFLEIIGQATDLKKASPELVKNRIKRTGDGTHPELGTEEARNCVKAVGVRHPSIPALQPHSAILKPL